MHEVSLCVREPQTAPQSPRMGGHRFEKNRVLNRTSNGGSSPQSVPRSLAWEGRRDDVTGSDMTVKPEVNKGVSVKRTLSTPILRENRDSIGWDCGRNRTSARSLTVMVYPCTCTPTRTCTNGGVNGST